MDIKYDDLEQIVSALSTALDIARNADFDFPDEEEQEAYWEQISEIEAAYDKAVKLI